MATSTPIRFRPTVILCVGDRGRAVGAQLSMLLPGLDTARQAGIALLSVDDLRGDDGALLGTWYEPGLSAVASQPGPLPDDTPVSIERRPLPTLVIEGLRGQYYEHSTRPTPDAQLRRGVLDDAVVGRIRDQGYSVPRAMAVVWIAAAADSPLLLEVARNVRTAMQSENVESWVLLALPNIYPRDPAEHLAQEERVADQPWRELLIGDDIPPAANQTGQPKGAPLATYAYLFETHDENGHFWEGPDEVAYGVAEAIFVLTATGITTTREFEETLRQSMPDMVRHPFERMSSIGTSRLTFPRAQAELYCASRLGASILDAWAPEHAADLSDHEQRYEAAEARRFLNGIVGEMRDSDTLVAALRRNEGRRSRRRAREHQLPPDRAAETMVFHHFHRLMVRRYITSRTDWPAALENQRPRADEGFVAWQEVVKPAWERYGHETERALSAITNNQVLEGAIGVERAYAYMDSLNQAILSEQENQTLARGSRHARYLRFLEKHEERSGGPWDAEIIRQRDDPEPTREEALIERLAARYRWRKRHRPAIATYVGAGMLVVPVLALLLDALFTGSARSAVFSLPLLVIYSLAVVALASWGYALWHRWQCDEALEELRKIYRTMYRYRCDEYEDELRAVVMLSLRLRAERILDRLANWERFIGEIARTLCDEADSIEQRLFNGAVGRRDILVANRRRLRLDGYSLRRFEEDVSKLRQIRPIESAPWHSNQRELLARLRNDLHMNASLVDSPVLALLPPIRAYCRGIVRPYLTGDLVYLSGALEAMPADASNSLFDTLIDRSVILYQPEDQPRAATAFMAARDEDRLAILRTSNHRGLLTLGLEDREWLATLRLLPGGTTPTFWRHRTVHTHPSLPTPDWASNIVKQQGQTQGQQR
ncbi:MAG TPA: hypothetical protein VFU63_13230 [Ktedonobacterales bacterium]|nr:hypothetical protein [Ktedonobacterales bacterium]